MVWSVRGVLDHHHPFLSPMKLLSTFAAACLLQAAAVASTKPNVIFIYADDLGYGDIGCNGAKGVATPNVDKLASEGINFTDGHAASSTCTPSRYSIMTGQYAFRQKGTGILPGDAEMIIKPGSTTLPSIFKQAGYTTGAVGKWHLGLGSGKVDWNGEIKPSPNDIGFDESFIMAATGDRVPTVYIRNHRVENLDPVDPIEVDYKKPFPGLPDGKKDRATLKMDWSAGHNMAVINGIGRIGYMKGGTKALWKDDQMSQDFTREALGFIEKHKDQPFFLYFATHNIHVPRVPNAMFLDKSTMGLRGASIAEFDWQVGQVMQTLDKLGLAENTMVILSSDNGPVIDDGYKDEAKEKLGDHKPAGPYNGGKYSLFEGGTRVPFIVRWKGKVKPGTSSAIVNQMDFAASFAALTGVKLAADAVPDSLNVMPALLGESKTGREWLVEDSLPGNRLAYREGDWKLLLAGGRFPLQLFNLKDDLAEKKDLTAEHPEVVERLTKRLEEIRKSERTRPQS
ncbi:sulfatase-like hydrolase/transferase [Luteolibacter ambystomatis]|uniref:Sulfatase-like hydrolase/transferase n=2 Tax=Luteolibacter ambystomatis TaxID=2824561 RepID=A0A975PH70_9BACT|nr:sulfatase-like hydrolase/transferase [Luteolibacter ambystomatis]